MDRRQGNLVRGHLEMLVLATLARGPMHGYEVLQRLESDGCGVFHLKEGTVYPVLYRLEEAGEISGAWESGKSGRRGPRRRVYRLTAKGRRSLSGQRGQWEAFSRAVNGILGEFA